MRDDSGVYEGYEVPIHYDPLHLQARGLGDEPPAAIERMRRAVAEYKVLGIRTTLPFFERVLRHPAFVAGDFDTAFVERAAEESRRSRARRSTSRSRRRRSRAYDERRRRAVGPAPAGAGSAWSATGRREAHAARIGTGG